MLSKTISVSKRFNSLPEMAGELAEFCQLLFALIVPHVDDFGRMTADPFSVKMTVMPASSRLLPDFTAALHALHDSELLTVYRSKDGDIWLQVSKFDEHQVGLHKRTESKIPAPEPDNSRNFPELPGNSWSRARAELNLTELNLTELKGTEGKGTELKISDLNNKLARKVIAAANSKAGSNGNGVNGRSKRPIFSGQRFVVFDWMLEDMIRTLGTHTEQFDLHAWFFDLDERANKNQLVIPRNEQWTWLQTALSQEARARGLPFATNAPQSVSDIGRQNIANAQGAVARIQGRK